MIWKKKIKIPASRLALYLVVLSFLPFLFIGYHFFQKKKEWNITLQQIAYVRSLSETKSQKQSLNNLVRRVFSETDPFYFANQLESLSFLKKEKDALENLMHHPAFTGNEAAEKRYSFITEGKNRLQFTEGSVQSAEGVTETSEILSHPVEIDSQDLKEILFRIEGNRTGKPLLIVTDFKLTKKPQIWGSEVFEVNLKLLKREFLQ